VAALLPVLVLVFTSDSHRDKVAGETTPMNRGSTLSSSSSIPTLDLTDTEQDIAHASMVTHAGLKEPSESDTSDDGGSSPGEPNSAP